MDLIELKFEPPGNNGTTCRIDIPGDTRDISAEMIEKLPIVRYKAIQLGFGSGWRVEKLSSGSFYMVDPT